MSAVLGVYGFPHRRQTSSSDPLISFDPQPAGQRRRLHALSDRQRKIGQQKRRQRGQFLCIPTGPTLELEGTATALVREKDREPLAIAPRSPLVVPVEGVLNRMTAVITRHDRTAQTIPMFNQH